MWPTNFGAGPVLEPSAEKCFDLRLAETGVAAAEVLPHQRDAGLEHLEREAHAQGGGVFHRPIVSATHARLRRIKHARVSPLESRALAVLTARP